MHIHEGSHTAGTMRCGEGKERVLYPHARHEECHCGEEEPDWKSLSDCILYCEKRRMQFVETTKQASGALAKLSSSILT